MVAGLRTAHTEASFHSRGGVMITSDHPEFPAANQGRTMRRRRYQKGSLQCRKQGRRRVWAVLYYNSEGRRQFQALGLASKMTTAEAEAARQEFMRGINGGGLIGGTIRPPLLREFLDETYLPF